MENLKKKEDAKTLRSEFFSYDAVPIATDLKTYLSKNGDTSFKFKRNFLKFDRDSVVIKTQW